MRHLVKTTVIYLCLVSPPFFGLVGILEVGKGISAPRSIGGEWLLDDASRKEAAAPCPGLEFDKQPTIKISQSGLRAEVLFADKAKTKLSVAIDGDHVTGSGGAGAGGCDQPLTLDAHLSGTGAGARLVGSLEHRGCASCPATAFRAGKNPPATNP